MRDKCEHIGDRLGRVGEDSPPRQFKRKFAHGRKTAKDHIQVGYYFGFKLHLAVNDQGELLSFMLTPGNVDDRKPVPHLVKRLWGEQLLKQRLRLAALV